LSANKEAFLKRTSALPPRQNERKSQMKTLMMLCALRDRYRRDSTRLASNSLKKSLCLSGFAMARLTTALSVSR